MPIMVGQTQLNMIIVLAFNLHVYTRAPITEHWIQNKIFVVFVLHNTTWPKVTMVTIHARKLNEVFKAEVYTPQEMLSF